MVLELSKKTRINTIEIGNFGSAFIEIHVCSTTATTPGSSSEWLTLLPSCMLMTVHDSRAGRNKTSTLTCAKERFSATAAHLKWSRIKLICRQPYNTTTQFGLQHVAFFTERGSLGGPVSPQVSQSPHHQLSSPSPTESTHQQVNTRHRLPSLPSSGPFKQRDPNSKPPRNKFKRPLRDANDNNESCSAEFTGVERQSRLLNNALKSPEGESHGNPILERVAREREKVRQEVRFEACYQKRRLLVRELCKAEGKTDFATGFDKSSSKSVEMSAAIRKISRHGGLHIHVDTLTYHTHTLTHTHIDNGCEIGQEPEHGSWGGGNRGSRRRGRNRKVSGGEDVWVTKRRRKLSGVIDECQRVLSEEGSAGDPISPATDTGCVSDSDSDATIIMDSNEPTSPLPPPLPPHGGGSTAALPDVLAPSKTSVQCPLCGQHFPTYAIELHAANCSDSGTATDSLLPIYIN